MKFGLDDLYEGPRFQRSRRRKIKLIISSIAAIIGIVVVIGIINIFSGDEEASTKPEEEVGTEQTADTNEDTVNDSQAEDQDSTVENSTDTESTGNNNNYDQTVIDDKEEDLSPSQNNNLDSESQVAGTVENNGEPVGTKQQGDHVTDFTKGSQDWQEMTQAVSSATGLTNDAMIIWWMGNGGAPNKAVSTVSTKDKQTYYRVQLEWVDNEGWKPVKVEQVEGIDKPSQEETNDANN